MINNCDICKNKEKCSKIRINSKEWNNLTCYDFDEISSPQLVEYIIKNFCKDEHRSDLWINIETPLYKTLKALEKLEKIKKALEIIKEKRVDMSWFYDSEDIDRYNSIIEDSRRYLIQEEFDLLKEV